MKKNPIYMLPSDLNTLEDAVILNNYYFYMGAYHASMVKWILGEGNAEENEYAVMHYYNQRMRLEKYMLLKDIKFKSIEELYE